MFHQRAAEHILFISAHRTFSRTEHILGHKSQCIQEDDMDGPMGVNTKCKNLCIKYIYIPGSINHKALKYQVDRIT